MKFIAQEMREIMAKLGVRTVEELCGRTDLLKLKEKQGFKRADLVDMSRVLASAGVPEHVEGVEGPIDNWKSDRSLFDFKLEKTVDEKTLLPLFEHLFQSNQQTEQSAQSLVQRFKRNLETVYRMTPTVFILQVVPVKALVPLFQRDLHSVLQEMQTTHLERA